MRTGDYYTHGGLILLCVYYFIRLNIDHVISNIFFAFCRSMNFTSGKLDIF